MPYRIFFITEIKMNCSSYNLFTKIFNITTSVCFCTTLSFPLDAAVFEGSQLPHPEFVLDPQLLQFWSEFLMNLLHLGMLILELLAVSENFFEVAHQFEFFRALSAHFLSHLLILAELRLLLLIMNLSSALLLFDCLGFQSYLFFKFWDRTFF